MATIGVSKPMYALYSNNGTAVTYSNGGVLGKMTDVDVSINTSEGNNLYADNGIAEMDRSFSDGTLTVGTDDLSQEVSKAILGVTEQPVGTIDGINPTEGSSYTELIFDDDMETPYLGVGFIIKKQKNNKIKWRAIMYTKVMFNVPDEAATTQGESIEWQTPSLVATIGRDDSEKHRWKREATFDTEAQATAYLKNRLNITEPSGGGTEEPPALRAAQTKTAVGDKV